MNEHRHKRQASLFMEISVARMTLDSVKYLIPFMISPDTDMRLRPALVTRILIDTLDLAKWARNSGSNIDDVIVEAVRNCRNAACHNKTDLSLVDTINLRFMYVKGKSPAPRKGYRDLLRSEYSDDDAIFFGNHRVYVKRHIMVICDAAGALIDAKQTAYDATIT